MSGSLRFSPEIPRANRKGDYVVV